MNWQEEEGEHDKFSSEQVFGWSKDDRKIKVSILLYKIADTTNNLQYL